MMSLPFTIVRKSSDDRRAWLAIGILSALALLGACTSDAPETDASSTENAAALRQFVLTRALGIENPVVLDPILARMPGIDSAGNADARSARSLLWQSFFRGALLATARTRSREPLALHYNPVSDVGLVQRCAPSDIEGLNCKDFCAFPGEILNGAEQAGFAPAWLSDRALLGAIADTTRARIRTFESKHPLESSSAADWRDAFCRPEWQVIAELRQLQVLRAVDGVDRVTFQNALDMHRSPAARRFTDERITYLLQHASEFSLVGAVAVSPRHRMLLFAPRRSAWYLVAVLMGPAAEASARDAALLEATVLSFRRGD